tara:strand:- start:595 stop:849 length:255 start_codon:yes stop_codon:yes gene_type:complete
MLLFKTVSVSFLLTFSFLLMGCSSDSNQKATPVLFDTKVEAEKAARKFNCKGAHQMGDKWMPCESHEEHQENKKRSSHGHHHHH